MSRTLTSAASLESLRLEARRWLKALRAGDGAARERLLAITPEAPPDPGLRHVQLALAREYGQPGWAALREHLEELAITRRGEGELADVVLRASWDGGDRVAALRIVERRPEIGAFNFLTAVVTGRADEVRRRLAAKPALASMKGGPLQWEPLLYLAYARLPGAEKVGVDIARLLLDHGAAPDAKFNDGWDNYFTALTGVIGEGEGVRLPHPQALEIAELLIERGASPMDFQALYNTSITHDDTGWLDFLWAHCAARGMTALWHDASKPLGGKHPISPLDYLLGNAVAFGHQKRVAWLLAHGANANGIAAYSGRSLRVEALLHRHQPIATLLEQRGATADATGLAAFQLACAQLRSDEARVLAGAHPDYLSDAEIMLIAAREGRTEVVSLLLDIGMAVDVADATGLRGLHNAVAGNSSAVVRLLLEHGADVDRPTQHYGGPLGFAGHFGHHEIAALLAPLSRDVHNLTSLGFADRLRELFAQEPDLVNAINPRAGVTPLFCLPSDEALALSMAKLLLAHGANRGHRNREGLTAAELARRRGLDEVVELLEAADPGQAPSTSD